MLYKLFATLLLPIYCVSYTVGKMFNVADEMPTIAEWLRPE